MHQITLEYPVAEVPRWGHGRPPHPELHRLLDRRRAVYAHHLAAFLQHTDELASIPSHPAGLPPTEPHWLNGFFSGLDALSLHGFLCKANPRRYVEIGSGNSTKFARRAIANHRLRTHVTSIDPRPRAEIDQLCDHVVRQPLESVDQAIFAKLEPDDVLFFDGSHTCFTNNDTTVFFLEILPRLAPGVLVHVHDVFLRYDYTPAFKGRYYSEQYLLACYLLAGGTVDVLFPAQFIAQDPPLQQLLAPWRARLPLDGVESDGVSFWMLTR